MERLLARRRTRELFFAGFILLMVSLQLLGPMLNRYGNSAEPWLVRVLPYLAYFPASLAGRGVGAPSSRNYPEFVLAAARISFLSLFFCGVLGVRFAARIFGGGQDRNCCARITHTH